MKKTIVGSLLFLSLSVNKSQAEKPPEPSYIDVAADFYYPTLENKVLPFVQDQYKLIRDFYGLHPKENYEYAKSYWKPKVDEALEVAADYYEKNYPGEWNWLTSVPTPLKLAMDFHIRKVFMGEIDLDKLQNENKLPEQLKQAIDSLARVKLSKDAQLQERLTRCLNRVRLYANDPSMIPYYKIRAVTAPFPNAFNTGATIFLTDYMAAGLDDDELTAVIAHEVSHGDQGHIVKNYFIMAKVASSEILKMIEESADFVTTGDVGKTLAEVTKDGLADPFIENYGKLAPRVEIEADMGAVTILYRAGIKKEVLKRALVKLHGMAEALGRQVIEDDNARDVIDALRDYPALKTRLAAIDFAGQRFELNKTR